MRRKRGTFKCLVVLGVLTFVLYLYSIRESNDAYDDYEFSYEAGQSELLSTEFHQIERLFVDESQNELYRKHRADHGFTPKHKNYLVNATKSRHRPSGFYLINEYTPVFGRSKYCQLKKDEAFRESYVQSRGHRYQLLNKIYNQRHYSEPFDLLEPCVYKNCLFTCEPSLARQSDALLFHWSDLTDKVLALGLGDDFSNIYPALFNFQRTSRQVWILWDDEANVVNPVLDKFKFNWTITFQGRSEASYCSYGCLVKSNANSSKFGDGSKFDELVKSEFELRANSALWFVSNCNSEPRMRVTANLGTNFRVIVFGGCSQTMREKFPSVRGSKIEFETSRCPRDSSCELKAFRSAKFYLSFENSNCSDYITEKFWKSLNNDLIPVVMQPNREFYEKIAPKNSFIHMADFGYDPVKLGAYLNKIGQDFELYRSFFEWKRTVKAAYDTKTLEQFRICELCARLNNQNSWPNFYYKRVSNFIESACTRK